VEPRDLDRTLRRLASGGWLDGARRFASSLRTAGHEPGRLLVVGTPDEEPWHLAAHLDDAARWRDLPALRPVLARWHVPEGAPPHLSVGIDAVHRASRGTTVLVATPTDAGDRLLERLDDARRGGATLFAMHPGSGPLDGLVHESLVLPPARLVTERFETASHVVTSSSLDEQRRRLWLPPRRRR
jgi:hypothetical protein